MKDFDQALSEISAIRVQIARSAEFRGYGPVTVAATGALAILASTMQNVWLSNPERHIVSYLGLWTLAAILAVALTGIEAVTRSHRVHSGLAAEMIWIAVEQFIPAAAAGMLVTLVLVRFAPESLWMLPGLWQILFSLGVFASCRFLPRSMFAVGFWYLFAGLICLAIAKDEWALSPLAMGLPYGVGQLLAATLLQLNPPESDAQV
jgi:hypothetical protein